MWDAALQKLNFLEIMVRMAQPDLWFSDCRWWDANRQGVETDEMFLSGWFEDSTTGVIEFSIKGWADSHAGLYTGTMMTQLESSWKLNQLIIAIQRTLSSMDLHPRTSKPFTTSGMVTLSMKMDPAKVISTVLINHFYTYFSFIKIPTLGNSYGSWKGLERCVLGVCV